MSVPYDPVTRPPAAAARPGQAPSVAWGVVGSLHRFGPLATLPGQVGVIRLLPNTIRYTRPPIGIVWSEVKAEPGRFEMVWPGDPAAARSLARVGGDLRALRIADGEVPPDHRWCRELDAAVFALLDVAEQLTAKGWGVGLLTPAGVLLHNDPAGVEAVPVDLGFTWTGEFGDPPWDHSPGRPPWLNADATDNPAARTWDQPPVEQQFAAPSGSPFPPAAPGSTVRTLAGVIGWTLTGEPDGQRIPSAGLRAPVWAVVRAALEGEFASPRAFADALRAAPPSTHFAEPPPVALAAMTNTPAKRRAWLAVALAFGVIAFALFLLFNGKKPSDSTTVPTTPDGGVPAPGDASKELDNYNRIPAADLSARLAQFPAVAAAAANANDPALSQRAAAARVKLFADWVTACETEVGTGAEAAKRGEAGHNLRKLTDGYATVFKDHPPADEKRRDQEQQWLDQYDRLADSLGWPR